MSLIKYIKKVFSYKKTLQIPKSLFTSGRIMIDSGPGKGKPYQEEFYKSSDKDSYHKEE